MATSSSIASRMKRPTVGTTQHDESELSLIKETVARLEKKLEERGPGGTEAERALRSLRAAGRDEQASMERCRTCREEKIVNYEYDRHFYSSTPGMIGTIHVANIFHPSVHPSLWKTKCGWKFGLRDKETWGQLQEDADLSRHGFCSRCLGDGDG